MVLTLKLYCIIKRHEKKISVIKNLAFFAIQFTDIILLRDRSFKRNTRDGWFFECLQKFLYVVRGNPCLILSVFRRFESLNVWISSWKTKELHLTLVIFSNHFRQVPKTNMLHTFLQLEWSNLTHYHT